MQTGEQKSSGLELDLAGTPLPGWDVIVGSGSCPLGQGTGSEPTYASYVYMGGTTKATWTGRIPGSDGIYSGDFTVIATPVDATVSLDATARTVVRGTSIQFTATPLPASLGGLAVPKSLQ